MNAKDLYQHARQKVQRRKKFYGHVISWVIMSIFFILLNLATTDYFWAIFPILGWGIGVAFHGIQVFTSEWEDTEIDREYERLLKKKGIEINETYFEQGYDEEDFV